MLKLLLHTSIFLQNRSIFSICEETYQLKFGSSLLSVVKKPLAAALSPTSDKVLLLLEHSIIQERMDKASGYALKLKQYFRIITEYISV